MFGWRGRIGYVAPGGLMFSSEFAQVLPEGMICALVSLGLRKLVPDEFKKVADLYVWGAEQLANRNIEFIAMGGTSMWQYMGFDEAEAMASRIQEALKIPTMLYDTTVYDALNRLSAKKIVAVSPWGKELMERGTKVSLQRAGFDVVNMKGLGLDSSIDSANQPPYASYRLAKEAFNETPEADAVYIQCPAWEVVGNIQSLEKDLGVPVVSVVTGVVWAALTTMNIKEPISGYGRLLEML